jgi:hypothetical protein
MDACKTNKEGDGLLNMNSEKCGVPLAFTVTPEARRNLEH